MAANRDELEAGSHLVLEHTGALACVARKPVVPIAGPWPVLCFLHGYDEGPPLPLVDGVTRHGPLRRGAAERAGDFLVVAPQLPRRGDLWHRHAAELRELTLEVCARLGGDASRLYLTGFSFGGNGVFDLGLAQPDLWAALWAVDPTRVPPEPMPRPVWLSIGDAARYNDRRFIERLELQPPGPGEGAGGVYLDEGQDHVGSATRAYADGRIYDWLLRYSRPGA